jgi:hypothetical protein
MFLKHYYKILYALLIFLFDYEDYQIIIINRLKIVSAQQIIPELTENKVKSILFKKKYLLNYNKILSNDRM